MNFAIETLLIEKMKYVSHLRLLERNCDEFQCSFEPARSDDKHIIDQLSLAIARLEFEEAKQAITQQPK